jgi:hypothetical protein
MAVYYTAPVKLTDPLRLDCDGDTHALDFPKFVPARTAYLGADVYLNVDNYVLTTSTKPARLRIFMRRAAWQGEPVDDTFFYDLWLPRPGYGSLDTRSMFEKADANRALTWRYQVNGATSVTLATRFVKYVQIV